MATFSIWEGPLCGITLKLGSGPPTLGDEPEDPDAAKVMEFEARSWGEASQVRNDHYGWGRYKSDYPEDREAIAD